MTQPTERHRLSLSKAHARFRRSRRLAEHQPPSGASTTEFQSSEKGAVEEAVGRARSLLVTLVASNAFVGLSAWNLSDADLAFQRATVALPGLGASVPVAGLLYLAPGVTCSLCVWFKLRVHDVHALDRRQEPSPARRWSLRNPRVSRLASLVAWLCTIVPIVLLWGKATAIKSELLTAMHVGILAALAAALSSELVGTVATLAGRKPSWWLALPAFGVGALGMRWLIASLPACTTPDTPCLLPFYKPELTAIQAAGMRLDGMNLTRLGRSFVDGNLASSHLSGTTLTGLDLSNANFAQARLDAAKLTDTKLDHAILSNAVLRNANLVGASLIGARLTGMDAAGATFSGTSSDTLLRSDPLFAYTKQLDEQLLQAGHEAITETPNCDDPCADVLQDLRIAILQPNANGRIDLAGINLSHTNLIGLDLSRANLVGATLVGADLSCAKLNDADLTRANLSGARLIGARLERADLTETELKNASLQSAELSNANLASANLRRAKLTCARASHANLSGAHLMQADLRGARLEEAQMQTSEFHETRVVKDTFERVSVTRDALGVCGMGKTLAPHVESAEEATLLTPCPVDISEQPASVADDQHKLDRDAVDKAQATAPARGKASRPGERQGQDEPDGTLKLKSVEILYSKGDPGSREQRRQTALGYRERLSGAGVRVRVDASPFNTLRSKRSRNPGDVQIIYRQYERELAFKVQNIIGTGVPLYSRSKESGTVQVWVF